MISDLLLIGRRTLEKEAQALSVFVDTLDETFEQACQSIFNCQGTVLLTGIGKSGLVARKWGSTFSSTGTPAYFINPAEAQHGDLGILRKDDILIALSYSGETRELESISRRAHELEVPLIAVTGNPNSSLSSQSQITLSVFLSEEACPLGLAPTTSTTIMMALGDAIAVTLMQMRGFTETDFAQLHPGGSLGRKLWQRVSDVMHTELPIVPPNAPMEKILLTMTKGRLGIAIVVEHSKTLGVITDGDLRRYFQKNPLAKSVFAKQIMTENPHCISQQSLAVRARELMERNSIHQLLVVNENEKVVGVTHLHDLLKAKIL